MNQVIFKSVLNTIVREHEFYEKDLNRCFGGKKYSRDAEDALRPFTTQAKFLLLEKELDEASVQSFVKGIKDEYEYLQNNLNNYRVDNPKKYEIMKFKIEVFRPIISQLKL
jgi:hypothetical protein